MKSYTISKILVPVDFSETSMLAVEHASTMASKFKADLILLHVVEKHWERFSIVSPELRVSAPSDLTNKIEKRLEDIAASIRSKYGVQSVCVTSDGNIFSEILAVGKEQKADLIVMGTHGTSGFVEFFIGSNTYKVVTEAHCPVISISSRAEKVGFHNIVLPIDNSMHSRQKVNYGVMMAKEFGAKLHILGLDDTDDAAEHKKFEMKLDQVEEYIHKCGLTATRVTQKGSNQSRMTYDYAKSINADLIVIMTDQDEDITGRLMGTYAQQIVNHSKIPVMSIHPHEGFIEFPGLGGGYHVV